MIVLVIMIRSVLREDLGNRTQQTLNYNYQLVRFQVNRARLTLEALAEDQSIVAALSQRHISDSERSLVVEKIDGAMTLVKFLENVAVQRPSCELVIADSGYARESFTNFFTSDYCSGAGHESNSYVSGLFKSSTTNRSVVAVTIAIYNEEDAQIGQITGVIDVKDLSLALSNLQENDGFTVVLDRYGNTVVDTRIVEESQGATSILPDPLILGVASELKLGIAGGFFDGKTAKEIDVIVGFHQYSADPGAFTVVNVAPRSLSYQLERRIIYILAGVGSVMIIALVFALWFTVRWSIRRLNRMTETIGNIAGGSEHERLPDEMFASSDEVGMLGRSFNDMIDKIHETQTALEDARAKSEAILLGIGDGVLAVDTRGVVILFNKAAEHISGLSAESVIGKPYTDTVHFVRGENSVPEDSFIQRALGGSLAVMPDDVFIVKEGGVKVPVADSSGPVMNAVGKVVGAVVVFRDVTHEREVDRLKSEFVSVASHQLRTPLTAIRWNLEDLQSEETGTLTPEQKESVTQSVTSTGRMIRLVNDLLDVSRLESGRLSVRPVPTDIAEMLKDIVQEDSGIARDKSCTVNLHLPEVPLNSINIDPTLIRQVAANLISNSIKYGCNAKQSPRVDVTLSKDGTEYYRVTIKDNGMGITGKDEDRIFQRFFRADNAVKQQTEGSGLGLYIAKLIIEESGGMISFSSKEGEGSTFWFLLPIAGSKERLEGKTLTSHESKK